jgi:hypothetical protein
MNETLTLALYAEFPALYAGHTKPADESSMSWGSNAAMAGTTCSERCRKN